MPEGDPAASGTGAGNSGAAGGTSDQNLNPDNIGQGGSGTGSGAGDQGGGGGEKQFAESYVKQLREEAAKNRAELKRVQEALKKHEEEKLTDSEKQALRLKELEEQNNQLQAKARLAEVQAAAARAGSSAPEVVAKLVDPEADNLPAAIEKIKKEYPMLFGKAPKGSADGGNNPPPAPKADMNAMIRKAAGYE